MNVALYLQTTKGYAVLQAALRTGIEISHVVTAPATGMDDDSHRRIELECKARNIPVFWHAAPPQYAADWSIAAGWRKLLDVPNLIVLHDSLLPRYRGFAPLVTALVNGEREIGVTAFLATEKPDEGPIIGQARLPVVYPTRVADVLARLLPLYVELAERICTTLRDGGQITYYEQDHSRATYSVWRDDDDYRIDWAQDAPAIQRLVDAVSDPFPGAWTTIAGGPMVKVGRVDLARDQRWERRDVGKIAGFDGGRPTVICGSGMLTLVEISGFGKSWEPKLRTRFA